MELILREIANLAGWCFGAAPTSPSPDWQTALREFKPSVKLLREKVLEARDRVSSGELSRHPKLRKSAAAVTRALEELDQATDAGANIGNPAPQAVDAPEGSFTVEYEAVYVRNRSGRGLKAGEVVSHNDVAPLFTEGERAEVARRAIAAIQSALGAPLSDVEKFTLLALHELGAVDFRSRRKLTEVAFKRDRVRDRERVKKHVPPLKAAGLVSTREGSGGGAWLTEAGLRLAEKLAKEK